MSLGAFVGKAAAAAVRELNPFGPEGYERRARNKAFRKARRKKRRGEVLTPEEEIAMAEQTVKVILPDGTETTRTEPTIKARTSTKMAIGNGVVAAFPAVELLQWIQSIEIPVTWLEAATNSDYFIYYGSLLISWAIARFTKSPVAPVAI